jgi:PHD/YefM family antitoxin component YafN of YafNO toxin-antitoxin module
MREFSVSATQEDISTLIEMSEKEPILVKRSGKPVSVIISLEQYLEFIEAIEELDDIAAAEESLREKGPNIPWEEVKKDLGL